TTSTQNVPQSRHEPSHAGTHTLALHDALPISARRGALTHRAVERPLPVRLPAAVVAGGHDRGHPVLAVDTHGAGAGDGDLAALEEHEGLVGRGAAALDGGEERALVRVDVQPPDHAAAGVVDAPADRR